ncbi:MAG: hypothetical protein H9872_03050 [Candidatus Cellulosilyticum pullistercoris]|uniref:Uncharacterized protein n=1 Tax=Candidatus Cellulosilyticum pullistercoris TaxID=2838521 RepID=A0A9E2KAY6_9FIRM|nr:hypothetical protein [Candidatus Cellulosilyticum pullistercoris]
MEKDEIVLNFEQDLNEIAGLIWGYMDQKYIRVIKSKIDGYRGECEANLCKEAQLLQALMPFLPEESNILQMIIDALIYNDVIDKSLEEHQELSTLYRDENKERQQIKKLVYKLIMFKLIKTIENVSEK